MHFDRPWWVNGMGRRAATIKTIVNGTLDAA